MIYKLQHTSASGGIENSAASLDIQMNGIIVTVSISILTNALDALNDFVQCELSFMSSNTFEVNDVRGSLAMCIAAQQFLTNGGGVGPVNHTVSGLVVPVTAGERIHMHTNSVGGVQGQYTGYLYVSDDAGIDKLRPKQRLR